MKALPEPQRRALRAARDHGDATIGLSGRSAWGGWTATARKLRGDGLLDTNSKITELGRWRIAIELGELPSDTPPPEPTPGPQP